MLGVLESFKDRKSHPREHTRIQLEMLGSQILPFWLFRKLRLRILRGND